MLYKPHKYYKYFANLMFGHLLLLIHRLYGVDAVYYRIFSSILSVCLLDMTVSPELIKIPLEMARCSLGGEITPVENLQCLAYK